MIATNTDSNGTPDHEHSRAVASLHDLKRLIRIGWRLGEQHSLHADELASSLERTIRNGLDDLRDWSQSVEPLHRLQFLTLETEFAYAFGKGIAPAVALSNYLRATGVRDIPRLYGKGEAKFMQRGDTSQLLRQRIWALMAASFYLDYSTGDVTGAVTSLRAIKLAIDSELKPLAQREGSTNYEPHGSRARAHEFLAQCQRTLGDFAESGRHFALALKHGRLRLARKLEEVRAEKDLAKATLRRQDDYQFSVISVARVLGGLGRLAMLQGRLRKANDLLDSSRTLLMPTGQHALAEVVESHLLIVDRRLAPAGSDAWHKAVAGLELAFERFRGTARSKRTRWVHIKDHDGARRCAQELARAYLEHAENLPGPQRKLELTQALKWISVLPRLADGSGGRKRGSPEAFRARILQTHWHLLAERPGLEAAQRHYDRAIQLGLQNPHYHLDLAGFDHVDVRLTVGALLVAKAAVEDSGPTAYDTAARHYDQLQLSAQAQHNLPLASEAMLRLASVQMKRNRTKSADAALAWWGQYEGFIEPQTLHELHRRIAGRRPPHLVFAEDMTLQDATDITEEVVCAWALRLHDDNRTQAAKALRIETKKLREVLSRRDTRAEVAARKAQQALKLRTLDFPDDRTPYT